MAARFFGIVALAAVGICGGTSMAYGELADDVALNQAWARQVLAVPPAAQGAPLMFVVHDDEPGTAKINHCAANTPVRLGDTTYEHGIGVNSNCTLRVRLDKPAARFQAVIGVDRNVDASSASLTFRVEAEGKELYKTGILRPTGEAIPIDVDLGGVQSFDLIVGDGGDGRSFDQGDWADARVAFADGSTLWLDEIATAPFLATELPFSFVYGGRPSSVFLGDWTWDVREEEVSAIALKRVVTITDPATKLEVRAECLVYLDTPGTDWTVYLTNRGDQDTPVIESLRALDSVTRPSEAPQTFTFESLKSSSGVDDWQPFTTSLSPGATHAFAPVNGRSSMGACPFFTVRWPGGGVATGIGWTGQWCAEAYNAGWSLRLAAGMQNLHTRLHPGESIRSPRILQVRFSGDDPAKGYNLFRRTMMAHLMPRVNGELAMPPIAHLSTSFYEMDRGTEADVLAHLASIEGLGFEFFWLDAYRGRTDFPTVGHYVFPIDREVNKERFPDGLAPIGAAAHAAGCKFLLWFEPERICPGTLMAEEHPEWVVLPDEGPWGMFNLAVPEARQHITDYLNRAIREYQIDCLRIDNAVQYAPLWAKLDKAAGPDRVGMAEIRYVEGLYRMWDDILAANPHVFIDNVSSGGHRIDLETCARAIPLWRTDATIHPLMVKDFTQAALQNQVMTAGLSRYVPLNVSGQSGATPYLFRSGFNGGISFCEDVRPEDYPRELLAQAIAEGKRIRKYYLGDLYALTPVTVDSRDWLVLQYDRPELGDGMVIAFRRQESRFTGFSLQDLRGVDPAAEYEVWMCPTYERPAPVTMTGAELKATNLAIDDCPGSVIIEYRLTGGGKP